MRRGGRRGHTRCACTHQAEHEDAHEHQAGAGAAVDARLVVELGEALAVGEGGHVGSERDCLRMAMGDC